MGDLLLGLGGRTGDVLEGLRGFPLVGGHQLLTGVRLDHHDANAVGDDVVQFPGDARPFQLHRLFGQQSRFRFQFPAHLLEPARDLPAFPQHRPGEPGTEDDHDDEGVEAGRLADRDQGRAHAKSGKPWGCVAAGKGDGDWQEGREAIDDARSPPVQDYRQQPEGCGRGGAAEGGPAGVTHRLAAAGSRWSPTGRRGRRWRSTRDGTRRVPGPTLARRCGPLPGEPVPWSSC